VKKPQKKEPVNETQGNFITFVSNISGRQGSEKNLPEFLVSVREKIPAHGIPKG
jgi:hypothetical protein